MAAGLRDQLLSSNMAPQGWKIRANTFSIISGGWQRHKVNSNGIGPFVMMMNKFFRSSAIIENTKNVS